MNRLEQLAAAAGPVSRETFLALEEFEERFHRWAQRMDLVAPSTLPETWRRHILDSAQAYPLVAPSTYVVDVGSGGGFPGAVLAILGRDHGVKVALVESNRKKAAFLKTSLASIAPNAVVHAIRVETALTSIARPDLVTARAFAPLSRLIPLLAPWLASGTKGLFYKGRDYRSELAEIADVWRFDLIEHPSQTEAGGAILELFGLTRRA